MDPSNPTTELLCAQTSSHVENTALPKRSGNPPKVDKGKPRKLSPVTATITRKLSRDMFDKRALSLTTSPVAVGLSFVERSAEGNTYMKQGALVADKSKTRVLLPALEGDKIRRLQYEQGNEFMKKGVLTPVVRRTSLSILRESKKQNTGMSHQDLVALGNRHMADARKMICFSAGESAKTFEEAFLTSYQHLQYQKGNDNMKSGCKAPPVNKRSVLSSVKKKLPERHEVIEMGHRFMVEASKIISRYPKMPCVKV